MEEVAQWVKSLVTAAAALWWAWWQMPVTSEKLKVTFRYISQLDASLCCVSSPPFLKKKMMLLMFKVSTIKTVERKIRP